jgi:hypothetical protein
MLDLTEGDGDAGTQRSSKHVVGEDGVESTAGVHGSAIGDVSAESTMTDSVSEEDDGAGSSRVVPALLTWKLSMPIVKLNPLGVAEEDPDVRE